ncbi:MAG: RNA-binding protein YhbY [Patescibacteria group bacterium]|jgi:RNA-binding protein YhbY
MVQPIKTLQMGKNSLSDAFIEQVKSFFETERMVKITILKSACRDKAEAKEIALKLLGVLGPKFDYKLVGYVITIIKFRKDVR